MLSDVGGSFRRAQGYACDKYLFVSEAIQAYAEDLSSSPCSRMAPENEFLLNNVNMKCLTIDLLRKQFQEIDSGLLEGATP